MQICPVNLEKLYQAQFDTNEYMIQQVHVYKIRRFQVIPKNYQTMTFLLEVFCHI